MKRQFAIKEYPVAIVNALLDLDICNREAYDKFVDGLTKSTYDKEPHTDLMDTIFEDGKFVKEYSLNEIRENLWGDRFYA